MTRSAKLYASLLANPNQIIAFRDFEALLMAFGFVLKRTKGSHRVYRHPRAARPFPVQPRGADAKAYQVSEFVDMVEALGLAMEK